MNEPDATVFATELPETVPSMAETMTATFAGPPTALPAIALEMSMKNWPMPVCSKNEPKSRNTNINVDATAVGVPARVVRIAGKRLDPMDQHYTPDPMAQELCALRIRLERIEKILQTAGADAPAGPQHTEDSP